jgi:predicted DNA-binding transcriptional regulator YafY
MNRIDRLFGIVLRLQRRKRIRAQDLARYFEVSERTIYRDIAALNELGVPIISLPNAGYELPNGFSLPPIFFSTGESSALILALQLFLAQTHGANSADAERAQAKIAAILPVDLREHVDSLSEIIRFYASDRRFDLEDANLALLQRAIHEQRVVRINYQNLYANQALERVIEPSCLTYNAGTWYLAAYCRMRQAARSFRLDRMDTLEILDESFTPRVLAEVPIPLVQVRIRFAPHILRWVRERQHFGFRAGNQDDAVLLYEVSDPLEMLGWLLSWGAQAEVLEPASLRARIREEIELMRMILT